MEKLFALVTEREARVTLKCEPNDTDILVSQFEAVNPGYHRNKRHWTTVSLDGDVEDGLLADLADSSYALMVKSQKRLIEKGSSLVHKAGTSFVVREFGVRTSSHTNTERRITNHRLRRRAKHQS